MNTEPDANRRHFNELTADEKTDAVRRLARQGFGDYEIAAATSLSVEMIRQLIANRGNR